MLNWLKNILTTEGDNDPAFIRMVAKHQAGRFGGRDEILNRRIAVKGVTGMCM